MRMLQQCSTAAAVTAAEMKNKQAGNSDPGTVKFGLWVPAVVPGSKLTSLQRESSDFIESHTEVGSN